MQSLPQVHTHTAMVMHSLGAKGDDQGTPSVTSSSGTQGVHGVKTTQHALALDYVTLSRVMEKLQANIQEDHQLTCGFMYATWKRVSACSACFWNPWAL